LICAVRLNGDRVNRSTESGKRLTAEGAESAEGNKGAEREGRKIIQHDGGDVCGMVANTGATFRAGDEVGAWGAQNEVENATAGNIFA
jgi:hypothetical protein